MHTAQLGPCLLLLVGACSSGDTARDGRLADSASRLDRRYDRRPLDRRPLDLDTRHAVADAPAYQGSFPPGAGLHDNVSLTVGGVARAVWVYVPQDPGSTPPLAMVFHETDGWASDALQASGAVALADSQKLVLVAPQARTMSSGDWDNHSAGQRFFEAYPSTSPPANNDLQLVQAIIVEAQRAYGTDPRRVYSLGFSNGAFFAIFTAFTLPGQVAAFAEASGGLVICPSTGSCSFSATIGASCEELAGQPAYCSCSDVEKPAPLPTAGRKPAGYLAHAIDDATVSVYYTCTLAGRMQQHGFPVSLALRPAGGHDWGPGFATAAWPFLSQFTLP